jgi:hypothetical protein
MLKKSRVDGKSTGQHFAIAAEDICIFCEQLTRQITPRQN